MLPERVTMLDLDHRVCPGARCRAIEDGAVTRFDQLHFTEAFAQRFAGVFREILVRHS
jgi:hypothetical protein